MRHDNASTPAPRSRARTGLVPLHGGPWLDNRLPAQGLGCVALGGVGLTLVSAAIFPHPDALRWVWGTLALVGVLIAVCTGLAASAAWMVRYSVQTCPECLLQMPRGATTCPHCHLHPPQEDV